MVDEAERSRRQARMKGAAAETRSLAAADAEDRAKVLAAKVRGPAAAPVKPDVARRLLEQPTED